jgi:predicted small secreted protein
MIMLLLITLVVGVLSIAGCRTVQGIGRDVQWMGEKGAEILEQ